MVSEQRMVSVRPYRVSRALVDASSFLFALFYSFISLELYLFFYNVIIIFFFFTFFLAAPMAGFGEISGI